MLKIISKKEAKRLGLKRYYTGEPCRRGHYSERFTNGGHCTRCKQITRQAWSNNNPDKIKEYKKKDYIKNSDKYKESSSKRYEDNKEECVRKSREYYYKNKQKVNKRKRIYGKEYYQQNKEEILSRCRAWKQENRDKVSSYSSKRRASEIQRTPPWLTKEQLTEIQDHYTESKFMTELTEVQYHVDHIIPLQGKNVSGLHVPWNLQVITAQENLIKSNRVEENCHAY